MKRYEIWRAKVRFEESEEVKERPVLIWNDTAFIIAYKMTSVDRSAEPEEFEVKYWKESGLTMPTFIRLRHVLRLEQKDMVCKIGNLDRRDILRFENTFAGIG